MKMNNQKGFSGLLLVIIVGVIVGIGVYLYQMEDGESSVMEYVSEVAEQLVEDSKESIDFEDIEEPEGTPEEIGNEALNELDALMNEVDATVIGEDLSDLEF